MDSEIKEEDVNDIDSLEPIDSSNVVVLTDETERSREYTDSSVSGTDKLKTGNILAQFFNLIAQIREQEFWRLNTSEINSLNKTCPKILPEIISEHAGIIGCALSILGIIVKRIKLEKELIPDTSSSEIVHDNNESTEKTGLTGSRGS